MSQSVNARKVAIVGCGFVGSAAAFTLMQSKLFSEMVLLDANTEKAEGEAMDIAHGISFAGQMKIYAGGYDDIADAAVIVVTAGANQKPNETRLDLVHKNVNIFKSIIPEIAKRDFKGILLIVANPVDILTYVAVKLSGLPENRVIGSGTVLDTARLKYALSEHLEVDSRNVHSFIIGEHGDSEIAAWSSANVSGVPLNTFCEMRGHFNHEKAMEAIAEKAMKKDTGARALRAIIEEFMLDIMYEIPKDDNIGRVTITRDYIEGTGGPIIDIRSISGENPDHLKVIEDKNS